MSATTEVLFEKRGRLGLITLNRPEAINALNHTMVRAIQGTLDVWRDDDGIATVALVGAGDRGLCAGGDIVSIYRDAIEGGDGSERFWREEYALNADIADYPKPFVAIMDGIVLGGGIGLSAHASHRVVTERSSIGMPEVTIGFVPDVGGTYLLSRAPGELGTHLALTAGTLSGPDALEVGFADHYLAHDRVTGLLESLEREDVDAAIARSAQDPPPSVLASRRTWIDRAYAADDVATILASLNELEDEDARAAAATIRKKSPTALSITLEALRRAARLADLRAVLGQELRVSLRMLAVPDFAEGIRAQVIDKDRNPRWSPAALAEVDQDAVRAVFDPLPDELALHPENHRTQEQ